MTNGKTCMETKWTMAVKTRDPLLSSDQRPIEGKVSKQADQGEWFNMNIVTYTRDQ